MDILQSQMLESVRSAVRLKYPNKDIFYQALVLATSIQPPVPAEDLILIDKLKAKSGLNDIEFFILSNKNMYKATLENLTENPMWDYFIEEARRRGEDTKFFSPAFQRIDGNEVVILSSKAYDEVRLLGGMSYSKVIAHELGHKYMRKSHIFRVVEEFLNKFGNDDLRPKAEFLYKEMFANNFADLLLSPDPLSPKNMSDVFRKTRTQLMKGK